MITTALTCLLPMTAPMPPRAAKRISPRGAAHTTPAPRIIYSPAGPLHITPAFSPNFCRSVVDGIPRAHVEQLVHDLELYALFRNHEDVGVFVGGRGQPLEDDGADAVSRHVVGGCAARTGFLDAVGERALAAHGKPAGAGNRSAAQQTCADNELVVDAKRLAGRVDLVVHETGDKAPGAVAVIYPGLLLGNLLGLHVYSNNFCHTSMPPPKMIPASTDTTSPPYQH